MPIPNCTNGADGDGSWDGEEASYSQEQHAPPMPTLTEEMSIFVRALIEGLLT